MFFARTCLTRRRSGGIFYSVVFGTLPRHALLLHESHALAVAAMFSAIGSLARTPLVRCSLELCAALVFLTQHDRSRYPRYTPSKRIRPSPPALPSDVLLLSSVLLALSSIAVSRLMLSIRSLAASLSLQPDWLLNNTELNRVNWKLGPREGEIVVEMDTFEDLEMEMDDGDSATYERVSSPVVHMSRVGVLEPAVYPGTRDYKSPPRVRKQKIDLG